MGQTVTAATRTGTAATEGEENLRTERTVIWIVFGVPAVLLLGLFSAGWGRDLGLQVGFIRPQVT